MSTLNEIQQELRKVKKESRSKDKIIEELKIREKQVYVIKEKGIPKINDNDIYSTNKLSDIIVHLTINK